MKNENGYVIYPDSIGVMDLAAACDKARELSLGGGETRVEDCDSEKTIARFRAGEEVA